MTSKRRRLGNRMRKFLIIINSLFLVIIMLFTPLAYYVFNLDYYEALQERYGVFSILDRDDVVKISEKIINFFKYREDLDYNDPALQAKYTDERKSAVLRFHQDEISHLYDVRVILTTIFIIYFISFILFIIILVVLSERNMKSFLRNTGRVFIIAPVIIFIIILLLLLYGRNFPVLFEKFHKVFFPHGNYAFAGNSLIISIFPFEFFYSFFIRLVTCSGIMSLIFLSAGIIFVNISGLFKNRVYD
ncbi:MAG: DUF1461 domain-containing protein [Actinomycetota bacterium]|nr:DUF1461 domain-containing protein [Actinomycetota bacterium]